MWNVKPMWKRKIPRRRLKIWSGIQRPKKKKSHKKWIGEKDDQLIDHGFEYVISYRHRQGLKQRWWVGALTILM